MDSYRSAGARLARPTHRIHILKANGDSYRLQKSKRGLGTSARGARGDP